MLFLRGLWWRRGFASAVLLVGTISAAAATLGPMYARAAAESTLTDQLRAGTYHAGLSFIAAAPDHWGRVIDTDRRLVAERARVRGYGRPIAGADSGVTIAAPGAFHSTIGTLATRDGVCAHVVLTAGRCPRGAGEAMVPDETTASPTRWTVGRRLAVHQLVAGPDGIGDGPVIATVRVVGAYRPRDTEEAYWFGLPYFEGRLGPAVTSAVDVGANAVFVDEQQFARFHGKPFAEVNVGVPIVPSKVRLADVPALRANVAAVARRFPRTTPQPGPPEMRTSLDSVLDAAARDKHQVSTATLVVICELAALALLVLFQVVGRAVDARGDEIALAKLRGFSPVRTVVFALGESLGLLLVAAPLGSALGYLVTLLLAEGALVPGTPVVWTLATTWALLAAVAGSLAAAALGAVRTLVRPVLEQWRFTSSTRRRSTLLLALDAAVTAAAVATLVLLRRGGDQPRTVYLLAPTLLVVAVAVVGVRLLPRAASLALGRTRATRHVAAFLALRQTVRRPGGMRLAALLAVAVGLATFALSGEAVARGNRAARAQTETGAPVQLGVQFEAGHDPEAAVDKADPKGRWAMTVATWTAEGGRDGGPTITGPVLGVEAGRLPDVGYAVRGQLSPAELARTITVPGAVPALFRGTRVQVDLDTLSRSGPTPLVRLQVRPQYGKSVPYEAGVLRPGRHVYTATVPCRKGCAFTGVQFSPPFDALTPMRVVAEVHAVRASLGGPFVVVPADVHRTTAWRAETDGVGPTVRITAAGGVVRVAATSPGRGDPILGYGEAPAQLPIVAAPDALAYPTKRTGSLLDYAGNEADYVVRRYSTTLPAVLDGGAVVHLDYIRSRVFGFDREAAWSVWLGPEAPADAVQRLEKAGLIVQNRHTEAARRAVLSRQGPALGLLLLLVCAIAAAVLAIGGTAVALLADGRRRSFELAALRVIGVRLATLRRSAVAEQLLLLGAAVVLGLPSGYVAARLVLPSVPEFSDSTPVVLRYTPSVLVALATAAALALLLLVTAVVAGRALARAAVPSRLREAAR